MPATSRHRPAVSGFAGIDALHVSGQPPDF
jgi:hypothetical protein